MTRFAGGLGQRIGLRIAEIDSLEAIDAGMWDELIAQCPDAGVFQSRQWLTTFARIFRPDPVQLKLIAAWQGEQLVGLAALMRAREGDRARAGDWLILGDDYSDYQIFPTRGDCSNVTRALLDAINARLPPAESVVLNDIPQYSTLSLCLVERLSHDGQLMTGEATPCPALRVSGNERGVGRTLSKHSVVRSERSLQRMGQLTTEHLHDAATIRTLLPGLFSQHSARWEHSDSPSLFRSEANRRFYEELTEVLAPIGALEYSVLRLNGEIAAQHFGLRMGSRLLWYKPAFDIALKRHSPGEVLLARLIARVSESALTELDFTRGAEPFKSRFASLVRFNRNFVWHRRGGDRWRAELRHLARMARQVLRWENETVSGGLGGAGQARRRELVLLLNADAATVAAWSSVVREGVEVRGIAANELSLSGEDLNSVLLVPCDSQAAIDLAKHPNRTNAMLPPGYEQCAQTENSVERVGPDGALLCVCAQGSVLQYFPPTENEMDPTVLVKLAERELDRLCWDGAATVHFSVSQNGEVVVDRVLPYLEHVDAAVAAGVDLPLALWRVASGLLVDPQPLPGRRVRS